MTQREKESFRCVIYTRKSSEEAHLPHQCLVHCIIPLTSRGRVPRVDSRSPRTSSIFSPSKTYSGLSATKSLCIRIHVLSHRETAARVMRCRLASQNVCRKMEVRLLC